LQANKAACNLFGYSKNELSTKTISDIFEITGNNFKLLTKKATRSQSGLMLTAINKRGSSFSCEVRIALFKDKDADENAVIAITDMSQSLLRQKNIDKKKEEIVENNILVELAKSSRLHELIHHLEEQISTGQRTNEACNTAFQLSFEGIWDWNLLTNECFLGEGFEELFGRDVRMNNGNVFTDWSNYLHTDDKVRVLKSLSDAIASSDSFWDLAYRFVKADGTIVHVLGKASILRDVEGIAIRLIGIINDLGRQQALDRKMEYEIIAYEKLKGEYQKSFKLIFDSSVDVLYDIDLIGNTVTFSPSFEEVFGYKLTGHMTQFEDWLRHIHPEDREEVMEDYQNMLNSSATEWKSRYRFLRADNTVVTVLGVRSIMRDSSGLAYRLIGLMRDISERAVLEDRLEKEISANDDLKTEYLESFKFIFHSAPTVLFDADFLKDRVAVSKAYETDFGYTISDLMTLETAWISHIHDHDKELVMRDYFRMLASRDVEWKCDYRFLKSDNTPIKVFSNFIVFRNQMGIAYRMIGFMQDTNKPIALEKELSQDIKRKEKRIAKVTLAAIETERLMIGKELDDHVNRLLGASRMYLTMAKQGGENSQLFLDRSSAYTLRAMEKIQRLSSGHRSGEIDNLGLCHSIVSICKELMDMNKVIISFSSDGFMEDNLNYRFKMDVFGIVQGELNTILRFAKPTKIQVGLNQSKKFIVLTISDDGIRSEAQAMKKRINIENVKTISSAYNGTADTVFTAGEGCSLKVTFSNTNMLTGLGADDDKKDNKHNVLISKIKSIIIELARSDEMPKTKFSDYLSQKLHLSYIYIANLFSEVEGVTLKKFIISNKIERVKELILYDKLNLTEIAWKLHFSSVAHLSNQFKKVTGLTPSVFKLLMKKHRTLLKHN